MRQNTSDTSNEMLNQDNFLNKEDFDCKSIKKKKKMKEKNFITNKSKYINEVSCSNEPLKKVKKKNKPKKSIEKVVLSSNKLIYNKDLECGRDIIQKNKIESSFSGGTLISGSNINLRKTSSDDKCKKKKKEKLKKSSLKDVSEKLDVLLDDEENAANRLVKDPLREIVLDIPNSNEILEFSCLDEIPKKKKKKCKKTPKYDELILLSDDSNRYAEVQYVETKMMKMKKSKNPTEISILSKSLQLKDDFSGSCNAKNRNKMEEDLVLLSDDSVYNENLSYMKKNAFNTVSDDKSSIVATFLDDPESNNAILSLSKISRKKKMKDKSKELVISEFQEIDDEISIVSDSCRGCSTDILNEERGKRKRKNIDGEYPLKKKKKTSESEDVNEMKNLSNFNNDEDDYIQIADSKKVKKNKQSSNPIPVSSDIEEETNSVICSKSRDFSSQNNSLNMLNRNNEKNKSDNKDKSFSTFRSKGRPYTISIAVPASILKETNLLYELKTYVIGQLARSACIYSVDEIIVYKECKKKSSHNQDDAEYMGMMKMILEYQECPQYLRKSLFPRHHYMKKAGVLNALNATHHFLSHEWSSYREGVVLAQSTGRFSLVDVGLSNPVKVDRKIDPGFRVTVKLPPEVETMQRKYGFVVSPEEPRTKAGLYWGYTVRTANSFAEIFSSDRFKDGYDLIIGTSDKGTHSNEVSFPHFTHALIVFGGVEGLEATMEADNSLKNSDPKSFFPYYLNVCNDQASRTIRTEEAVMITLTVLTPKLNSMGRSR